MGQGHASWWCGGSRQRLQMTFSDSDLCSFYVLVSLSCGGATSDNCTYLVQTTVTDATDPDPCTYTICKCNDNICRIRLDFTVRYRVGTTHITTMYMRMFALQTFTISGPVEGAVLALGGGATTIAGERAKFCLTTYVCTTHLIYVTEGNNNFQAGQLETACPTRSAWLLPEILDPRSSVDLTLDNTVSERIAAKVKHRPGQVDGKRLSDTYSDTMRCHNLDSQSYCCYWFFWSCFGCFYCCYWDFLIFGFLLIGKSEGYNFLT